MKYSHFIFGLYQKFWTEENSRIANLPLLVYRVTKKHGGQEQENKEMTLLARQEQQGYDVLGD